MSRPRHDAVVFDLDDTLHAERRFVLSGLRHVARLVEREYGVPASKAFAAAALAFRRGPRRDVLQAMCSACGIAADRVPAWVQSIRLHEPALRLSPAAGQVLQALRAEGRRLAVLTNGLVDVQRRKVAALGLDRLVDAVVYADAIAPGGKPDRRCFDAVVAALGGVDASPVMVGNAPVEDVMGARAAGWRAVLLSRRDDRVAPADEVVRWIGDVPAAIGRLERRFARAC